MIYKKIFISINQPTAANKSSQPMWIHSQITFLCFFRMWSPYGRRIHQEKSCAQIWFDANTLSDLAGMILRAYFVAPVGSVESSGGLSALRPLNDMNPWTPSTFFSGFLFQLLLLGALHCLFYFPTSIRVQLQLRDQRQAELQQKITRPNPRKHPRSSRTPTPIQMIPLLKLFGLRSLRGLGGTVSKKPGLLLRS